MGLADALTGGINAGTKMRLASEEIADAQARRERAKIEQAQHDKAFAQQEKQWKWGDQDRARLEQQQATADAQAAAKTVLDQFDAAAAQAGFRPDDYAYHPEGIAFLNRALQSPQGKLLLNARAGVTPGTVAEATGKVTLGPNGEVVPTIVHKDPATGEVVKSGPMDVHGDGATERQIMTLQNAPAMLRQLVTQVPGAAAAGQAQLDADAAKGLGAIARNTSVDRTGQAAAYGEGLARALPGFDDGGAERLAKFGSPADRKVSVAEEGAYFVGRDQYGTELFRTQDKVKAQKAADDHNESLAKVRHLNTQSAALEAAGSPKAPSLGDQLAFDKNTRANMETAVARRVSGLSTEQLSQLTGIAIPFDDKGGGARKMAVETLRDRILAGFSGEADVLIGKGYAPLLKANPEQAAGKITAAMLGVMQREKERGGNPLDVGFNGLPNAVATPAGTGTFPHPTVKGRTLSTDDAVNYLSERGIPIPDGATTKQLQGKVYQVAASEESRKLHGLAATIEQRLRDTQQALANLPRPRNIKEAEAQAAQRRTLSSAATKLTGELTSAQLRANRYDKQKRGLMRPEAN